MALLPPSYLDRVFAIGIKKRNEMIWYGTGFFYGHRRKDEEGYYPFLVTNRHILEPTAADGHREIFLKLNRANEDESTDYPADLYYDDGEPAYLSHPNKSVDISILPITNYHEIKNEVDIIGFRNDLDAYTIEELQKNGVIEGDGVFVLGFPMGNVGVKRKSTIVRQGCLARIQDVINHENNEILLDALIFPGNSGGPVIIKPESTHIEGTSPNKDSRLIGIVGHYLTYDDTALSEQTATPRITFSENSGLASAYPVDLINETIEVYRKRNR